MPPHLLRKTDSTDKGQDGNGIAATRSSNDRLQNSVPRARYFQSVRWQKLHPWRDKCRRPENHRSGIKRSLRSMIRTSAPADCISKPPSSPIHPAVLSDLRRPVAHLPGSFFGIFKGRRCCGTSTRIISQASPGPPRAYAPFAHDCYTPAHRHRRSIAHRAGNKGSASSPFSPCCGMARP